MQERSKNVYRRAKRRGRSEENYTEVKKVGEKTMKCGKKAPHKGWGNREVGGYIAIA